MSGHEGGLALWTPLDRLPAGPCRGRFTPRALGVFKNATPQRTGSPWSGDLGYSPYSAV